MEQIKCEGSCVALSLMVKTLHQNTVIGSLEREQNLFSCDPCFSSNFSFCHNCQAPRQTEANERALQEEISTIQMQCIFHSPNSGLSSCLPTECTSSKQIISSSSYCGKNDISYQANICIFCSLFLEIYIQNLHRPYFQICFTV